MTHASPQTPSSRVRELAGRADAVLLAVVVLGLALRLWGLGAQSLWYDEWLTTEATSGGVWDVFRHAANREGIPPTYFVLMWGWVRAFGDGAIALRTVSALFGAATVPVAYAVARELGQRRTVARVAALLVAVNPMLVWYSQEARAYSVLAFLGALSLLAFARVHNRCRSVDFVLWGLVCAAAIAMHYFALFLVLAEAVALLVIRRRRRQQLLLACVPSAIVLAALAPFALEQYSHEPNRQWISDFALADRLSEAGSSALVGPSAPDGRLRVAGAVVVALATLVLIARGSRQERAVAALTAAIGGAAVVLPLLVVVVGVDVFLSRYLIAAIVPLIVAVSVCLATRKASWVGGAGVAVLCAISLATVVAVARDPELEKPDWRAVASSFERDGGNRLLLLNVHGQLSSPLLYYLRDARPLGENETARLDEIDVLVAKPTDKPCDALVGNACALIFLGAPLPEPVASEFKLEGKDELDQFTVERYRAGSPLSVTKSQLVTPGDLPDALALLNR